MILLARNLHSVRRFSSQPCLMTPEGRSLLQRPVHVKTLPDNMTWKMSCHERNTMFGVYVDFAKGCGKSIPGSGISYDTGKRRRPNLNNDTAM